jgi:hypothetical protein
MIFLSFFTSDKYVISLVHFLFALLDRLSVTPPNRSLTHTLEKERIGQRTSLTSYLLMCPILRRTNTYISFCYCCLNRKEYDVIVLTNRCLFDSFVEEYIVKRQTRVGLFLLPQTDSDRSIVYRSFLLTFVEEPD